MRRLAFLIRKEIASVRSGLAFHLIVAVMPMMFLCFWALSLENDVTFPVILAGDDVDPAFERYWPCGPDSGGNGVSG